MKLLMIVCGATLLSLPAAAAAQSDDCATIKNSSARLACYDKTRGSASQTGELGSVEGTITWQYNNFVGTKGDTGATIVLIRQPMSESLSGIKDYHLTGIGLGIVVPLENKILASEADGYGHYVLADIPDGEYLAVIVSDNTRMFDEGAYTQACNAKLTPFVEKLRFYKKAYCRQVSVRPGNTLRLSHDFGNTGY